jgi:hypothetical protein
MTSQNELPRGQIFVIDNILSFDECQELINIIDKHATVKECYGHDSNVQSMCIILEMLINSDRELHDTINKMISKFIKRIIDKVRETSPIDVSSIKCHCGCKLRKIHGPTRIHEDGALNDGMVRIASVIIALNGDYEGGEIVFPEQDVKIKLKAGQALFFPPYWSHPHKTLELHGTYRYTMNTWLCY